MIWPSKTGFSKSSRWPPDRIASWKQPISPSFGILELRTGVLALILEVLLACQPQSLFSHPQGMNFVFLIRDGGHALEFLAEEEKWDSVLLSYLLRRLPWSCQALLCFLYLNRNPGLSSRYKEPENFVQFKHQCVQLKLKRDWIGKLSYWGKCNLCHAWPQKTSFSLLETTPWVSWKRKELAQVVIYWLEGLCIEILLINNRMLASHSRWQAL